jgi:hypothetical protein
MLQYVEKRMKAFSGVAFLAWVVRDVKMLL